MKCDIVWVMFGATDNSLDCPVLFAYSGYKWYLPSAWFGCSAVHVLMMMMMMMMLMMLEPSLLHIVLLQSTLVCFV